MFRATPPHRWAGLHIALAIAGTVAALPSHAQTPAPAASTERPWYIGLTQEFSRVSNVLNSTSGNEVSDTLSTTTLSGGVNTWLGRQRLFADANLNTLKHQQVDARDADGYDMAMGLDWSTVERLSGRIKVGAQQRQTEFGGSGVVQTTLSNVEKTQLIESGLRLGGDSLLAYEIETAWRKVRFEAPEFVGSDYTQKRASMGLVYRPSGALSLRFGAGGSRTTQSASGVRNSNNFGYLGGTWIPTGISTVSANLSYENEGGTSANEGYKGLTGLLSWRWQPTGRLSTTTTLSRVTGREAGFVRSPDAPTNPATPSPDPASELLATNFSRVTNGLSLSLGYAVTGKLSLSAGLSANERSYGSAAGGGKDSETAVNLGARWAVMRTVSVGCNLGYSERNSSGATTGDSTSDTVGCSISLRLD